MGLKAGIVGLPNVGKSTLFNALTQAGARVENYPFCTIDPNLGIVPVPDDRLDRLAALLRPPKTVPATLEVVDIAGLVRGAARGEGLGNQFLGHIRNVDALLHVVRCFAGEVTHVEGTLDPGRDLEVVELELALADLQTVEKRLEKVQRELKVGVKAARDQLPVLEELRAALGAGTPVRLLPPTEKRQLVIDELGLLTAKPVLVVANLDEGQLRETSPLVAGLRARVEGEGGRLVGLCGEMEMEIGQLEDPAERQLFLEDLGLAEPGLNLLAREAYSLLGLITYYTYVGGTELRAWPIPQGTPAPRAAGKIHTDFERGFIRAEVCGFADYLRLGGEAGAREHGLLRSEGKEYVIQDGEVVHYRFHV